MTELELKSAQLDLEREKFEEARLSNARAQDFEEEKFNAEQSRSKWVRLSTQLSVVVPVVVLLIGAVIGRLSDNAKRDRDQDQQINNARREFVHRQLSSFYYPIEVRLQQDDDAWHLAFPQAKDPESLKKLSAPGSTFSLYIQTKLLIPNHEQVLQIIGEHADLLENTLENPASRQHINALLRAISQYREHVALYKALMENHLNMTPADLDSQDKQEAGRFRFPVELEQSVKDRINDLFEQLRLLGEEPPSGSWWRLPRGQTGTH